MMLMILHTVHRGVSDNDDDYDDDHDDELIKCACDENNTQIYHFEHIQRHIIGNIVRFFFLHCTNANAQLKRTRVRERERNH